MSTHKDSSQFQFRAIFERISDNIAFLFAMTRTRPTVVAGVLTLNLYIFVFKFKSGQLGHYGLSDSFVVLSLTSIVQCLMNSWLYAITAGGLLISAISFVQSRSMLSWKYQILFDVFILSFMLLGSWWLDLSYFYWLPIFYVAVSQYPWRGDRTSVGVVMNSILVCFITFLISYSFGKDAESKKTRHLVLEEKGSSWVLIDNNENRLVFAKLLREAHATKSEFLFLDVSVMPRLTSEDLGNLNR